MPLDRSLLAYIIAALVILLIPGPGVLYVVARSLHQGQRAGLASAAGLSTGTLVHVAGATAGLSAILLASATAFGVVKALGGAYLIYLGVRTMTSASASATAEPAAPRSLRRVFRDGVLVSVFNPKIAVFFLAFLPQFADPRWGSVPRQVLFLGLLYISLALVTDSMYALLASRLRQWFGPRFGKSRLPRIASGTIYIGLGVTTALADRR